VLAALGERADWFLNIQASPPLEVQTGRLRYVPQVRFLMPEERHQVWTNFERSHPLEARVASWVMGWHYDGSAGGREKLAHDLRLVAFRPEVRESTGGS